MSGIEDYKVTDTTGYKVADTPGDSLTGTVEENKQVFDKLGELIISHFNDAIDYLKGKKIDNSYTAKAGNPAEDQTPGFGDDVTVSQVITDNSGRVTDLVDHAIMIPDDVATTSKAGLLSAEDKLKLDNMSGGVLRFEGTIRSGGYQIHTGSVDILATSYGLEDWGNWAVVGIESRQHTSSGSYAYTPPSIHYYNNEIDGMSASANITNSKAMLHVSVRGSSTNYEYYDYRVTVMQVQTIEVEE